MKSKDRYYNPYRIGKRLYWDGYGASHVIGAVKSDADIDEAMKGFMDAKALDETRNNRKEVKSKLGYSRVGLNNV